MRSSYEVAATLTFMVTATPENESTRFTVTFMVTATPENESTRFTVRLMVTATPENEGWYFTLSAGHGQGGDQGPVMARPEGGRARA